jgi:hypothetical protein
MTDFITHHRAWLPVLPAQIQGYVRRLARLMTRPGALLELLVRVIQASDQLLRSNHIP